MGKSQHSTQKIKPKTKPQLRIKSQHPEVQPSRSKSLRSNARKSAFRKVGIPTCEKSAFRHGEKSAFHSKVKPKTKPQLRAKSQHPEVQPSRQKSLRSNARKVGIPTLEKSAFRRSKSRHSDMRKVGLPTCARKAARNATIEAHKMPYYNTQKSHIPKQETIARII